MTTANRPRLLLTAWILAGVAWLVLLLARDTLISGWSSLGRIELILGASLPLLMGGRRRGGVSVVWLLLVGVTCALARLETILLVEPPVSGSSRMALGAMLLLIAGASTLVGEIEERWGRRVRTAFAFLLTLWWGVLPLVDVLARDAGLPRGLPLGSPLAEVDGLAVSALRVGTFLRDFVAGTLCSVVGAFLLTLALPGRRNRGQGGPTRVQVGLLVTALLATCAGQARGFEIRSATPLLGGVGRRGCSFPVEVLVTGDPGASQDVVLMQGRGTLDGAPVIADDLPQRVLLDLPLRDLVTPVRVALRDHVGGVLTAELSIQLPARLLGEEEVLVAVTGGLDPLVVAEAVTRAVDRECVAFTLQGQLSLLEPHHLSALDLIILGSAGSAPRVDVLRTFAAAGGRILAPLPVASSIRGSSSLIARRVQDLPTTSSLDASLRRVLSRYDPARVPLLRDDDLLLAALQDVVTGEGDVGRREVRRELLVVTLISTAFLVGVLFAIRGARALALAILIALASCLVPRALRRVRGQEGVALQGVRLLIEESGQPDPLRADVLRLLPCPGGTIHLDSSPGFSGLSDGDGAPGSARVEAPLGVVVRGIQSGRAIPSLGIELVPGERLTNGSSVRLDEVWTREEAGWRNIGPLGPGGTALAGHRRASSTGSLARVVRQLEEIGLVHPPAMVARIEARSSGVAPLVAGWSGLGDPWELPMLLIVLGPDP